MKRSHRSDDGDEGGEDIDNDDGSAEMMQVEGDGGKPKVEDVEGGDADDDIEAEEEHDEPPPHKRLPVPPPASERSEFMEAFYGLASTDARERSIAGQVILHHAVLHEGKANIPDAAYALHRLLNGLCSGRAAARQGNASCLALFLKVTHAHGSLSEILAHDSKTQRRRTQQQQTEEDQPEETKPEENASVVVSLVRRRLLRATSLVGGGRGSGGDFAPRRHKTAEWKDHQFGRLFGILALVRSGLLLSRPSSSDTQELQSVIEGLVADLHELYHSSPPPSTDESTQQQKEEEEDLREPVTHAVCTLLQTLSAHGPSSTAILGHVVEHCVVPQFLQHGPAEKRGSLSSLSELVASFTAEQVALACHVQALSLPKSVSVPSLITADTLPVATLVATCGSSNHQQRLHLVWDALWLWLTETQKTTTMDSASSVAAEVRVLKHPAREQSALASPPHQVLEALIAKVVVPELVQTRDLTPREWRDRKLLALALVRILAGVEFVSSLTGRTVLHVLNEGSDDEKQLSSLLFSDTILRDLFYKSLTGQSALLRTTAHDVLHSLVVVAAPQQKASHQQWALLRALVRCDARFDSKTKTTAIQTLLQLNDTAAVSQQQLDLWTRFIAFCQDRILMAQEEDNKSADDKNGDETMTTETTEDKKSDCVSPHEAAGLIDLLVSLAKRIVRLQVVAKADDEEKDEANKQLMEFRDTTLHQLTGFFLATSLCGNAGPTPTTKKPAKRKSKSSSSSSSVQVLERLSHPLPVATQRVLAVRLFATVSHQVTAAYAAAWTDRHASSRSTRREVQMFQPLLRVMEECQALQAAQGAGEAGKSSKEGTSHQKKKEKKDDSDDESMQQEEEDQEQSAEIVSELLSQAKSAMARILQDGDNNDNDSATTAQDRFAVSLGLLAAFLQLCLLTASEEDEDDSDEIHALLQDAQECAAAVLSTEAKANDDDEEENNNRLLPLLSLCIHFLSWEVDDGEKSPRGAARHLMRDICKVLLPNGLVVVTKTTNTKNNNTLVDAAVADLLLEAVGAGAETEEDEEEDDDDDDGEAEDSDMEEKDEGGTSAKIPEMEEDGKQKSERTEDEDNDDDDDDDEVMIDPARLSSLLENEGDDEEDEAEIKALEHHEGADQALAMFLKRKQEARKAGQAARDRIALARHGRCLQILETVLLGRPESWGALLRCNVCMSMVPTLLKRVAELDKSSGGSTSNKRKASESDKVSDPCAHEKGALSNKLASFVSTKLLKSRMGNMAWDKSNGEADREKHCRTVTNQVMQVAESASTSDKVKQLCYQALPSLIRCMPSLDARVKVARDMYTGAIVNWTTNRNARLHAPRLLEELLVKDTPLAHSILVEPLSKAIPVARVRFLRSECLRLLVALYNPKLVSKNSGEPQEQKQAVSTLLQGRSIFFQEACVFCLTEKVSNKEAQQTKWIKEVLGILEKVLTFQGSLEPKLAEDASSVISLEALASLETALETVTTTNAKTEQVRHTLLEQVEAQKALTTATMANKNDNDDGASPSSGKKSSKKKSKKKKK